MSYAPGPSPHELLGPALRAAVDDVVADVLRRRESGGPVDDAEVIAKHPRLMPALGDRLRAVASLRSAYLMAEAAGPLNIGQVLSEEELEAPITIPSDEPPRDLDDSGHDAAGASHLVRRLPHIRGYEIQCEIGAGGQATVFKAKHVLTGRTVAMKIILGGPLANSRHRARFEREVAILASLNHPNVVNVFDRGSMDDGSAYYVMNFVSDSLAFDEYVTRHDLRSPGRWRDLVRLWSKVARALDEVHRAGVVHRDVKPSNVLVDSRGEPHVVDFGLARNDAFDPLRGTTKEGRFVTQTGQVLGSLPWASPEQIAGRLDELDARSDVYSAGVMMYQTLTGRFPYPVDGSLLELAGHVTHTPPAPCYERRPDAKRPSLRLGREDRRHLASLDAVLRKALAKLPADRYATAGALADDLGRWLDGKAVTAGVTDGSRELHRLRRPRVLTALFVLALVAALSVEAWRSRRVTASTALKNEGAGLYTRPPSMTNSIGMRLVQIAPNRFMMGSDKREEWRRSDELRHEVMLSTETWCGSTEVTQKQYQKVCGSNPSDPRFIGDDLPVNNITWEEAREFCRRLSDREGQLYRLPTEAEWECACRCAASNPPQTGGTIGALGWCRENSGDVIHAVAGRSPSTWGIYDMHGNVAEWCLDSYASPYAAEVGIAAIDPVVDSGWYMRVVRGGAANVPEAACRASARDKRDAGRRDPFVGFRVVMLGTHRATTQATQPSLPLH